MLAMSIIELPALEHIPGGGITAGLRTGLNQVRVLQRDLVGKSCWDISPLYCSPNWVHEEGKPNNINFFFFFHSLLAH